MWAAKKYGAYAKESDEAYQNAVEIYNLLSGELGWTLNAVCGVLGNLGRESGYNPWRWEGDKPLASTDTTNIATKRQGYGFVQFTPSGKYINNAKGYDGYGPNFSDKVGSIYDGRAQFLYINGNADYIMKPAYPLTYAEFKVSTESPYYLAGAWLYNYERPKNPAASVNARGEMAEWWWDRLGGGDIPPRPPGGDIAPLKTGGVWRYYMRRRIILR